MKKLFAKVQAFIQKIFGNSLEYLKKNSAMAVKVTELLKKYVESPISDVAVNIIPGELDNAALIALRKVVPDVVVRVAIFHGIVQSSVVPSEAIDKILLYLKSMNKEARAGFWITFAAQINMALSDGKLTFNEAVILSQLVYKEFYEQKQLAA